MGSYREIIHSHAMQSLGTFLNDYSNKNVPNDYLLAGLDHGNVDVLAPTDTMTQSEGTKKIGAPARDRGSGLRQ